MTQSQIKQLIADMRSGGDTKISGDELEMVLNNLADAVPTSQTLVDGSTINVNVAQGAWAKVTIAGNRAFGFSNLGEGSAGLIFIKQDATGGRSATWPVGAKIPTGGLSLSSAANSTTIIGYLYDGTDLWLTKENY